MTGNHHHYYYCHCPHPAQVIMAVAAMVARQMREQQQRDAAGPDETWTQEECDLFELQRISKATFKV